MTRRLSPAELDQHDAIAAMRQPPRPQPVDPRDKTIAALRSKLDKQRNEIGRLTRDNEGLRNANALLLIDLNNERAAHDRLRALARAAEHETEGQ